MSITKFADICSKIGSGATPRGGKEAYCNDGIAFIRSQNVLDLSFSINGIVFITDLQAQQLKNVTVEQEDVLLNITGDSVARACIVPYSLLPARVNQHVAIIRGKTNRVSNRYLLYYLQYIKPMLLSMSSSGATRNAITKAMIEEIEIDLPSLDVQNGIVKILYCIDEKIEMNNKINDNLTDLLQAIHQESFYNSEKVTINGFLVDVSRYSKARISISELSLDNYYSTENMLPGKVGATKASSLPSTSQTTRCSIGDILVSNIRPYFKKIVYCQNEGGCSADVLCFTPKFKSLSAYLYCTLYTDQFFNFMVAGSRGTKMPRGDKHQIMTYPIYIPKDDELATFNASAAPILAQISLLEAESKHLADIRDIILPKLMSGELDVSNAHF